MGKITSLVNQEKAIETKLDSMKKELEKATGDEAEDIEERISNLEDKLFKMRWKRKNRKFKEPKESYKHTAGDIANEWERRKKKSKKKQEE
tara:strand:- start:1081 stop:1353 length:273 start_codon:yes stop_codon:yes gene_type:complete